jgi:hypothetical protein
LRCEFKVFNGKTKSFEKLLYKGCKTQKKIIQLKYAAKTFDWELKIVPKGKLFIINSKLNNKINKDLWLEPTVGINIKTSKNNFFWGGFDPQQYTGKAIVRKGIKGKLESRFGTPSAVPFPLAAFQNGSFSIFIGHILTDPVSYATAQILPKLKKSSELVYSIRVVVSPKQVINNRFLLGSAPTEFGFEEGIVQSQYESIPECWAVKVGQDNPYIWGAHGHYLCWKGMPDYEKQRRLYITMDWAYCPYKRSGDIVGKKEFWNYTANSAFYPKKIAGRKFDFSKISREEFRKQRKALFLKYAKDFGFMFYAQVTGTWCEYNLAKKYYSDAINYDTEGGVRKIISGWSTVHDKEIRTFPLATSFGKILRQDLKTVYEELNLPGFALDCAVPGANYRGPAITQKIPGRAWDGKGVFIDQGVAVANLTDYIHNMVKTDNPAEKLVVWANGFVGGDYIMMECSFLSTLYQNWYPSRKFFMGPRPGCSHKHGFMLDQTIPDWRKKDQKYFREVIPKLADYIIFNEFKAGMTDSYITQYGNPQITYCMPEVIEMMRAGWQAVVPVIYHSPNKIVYKSRYGRGADTCFFFGNPYQDNRKLKISIDNKYLGDKNYLFVKKMRDFAVTQNTVKKDLTLLNLNLNSREPYLIEAVCGLSNIQNLNCKVSSIKDINKIQYKIKFIANKPFRTNITPRKIRLFSDAEISVNGQKIDSRNCLVPGNALLELTYFSKRFQLCKKELLNFPFVDGNKKVCFQVLIPNLPNSTELDIAKKVQWYFDFCINKKIINPNSSLPATKHIETLPVNGKNLIILTGENRIEGDHKIPWGISRKGNSLFIKVKNDLQGRLTLTNMQHFWDERFEYIFPFASVMGLGKKHLKHFKMLGKYLPYKKYFENTSKENNK